MSDLITARAPAPATRTEAWAAFIAANLQRPATSTNKAEKTIRRQAKYYGLHLFASEFLVNRQACRVVELRTGNVVTIPVGTTPHRPSVSEIEALLEKYEVLPEWEELLALQRAAVEWYGHRQGSIVHYILTRSELKMSDVV